MSNCSICQFEEGHSQQCPEYEEQIFEFPRTKQRIPKKRQKNNKTSSKIPPKRSKKIRKSA